MDVPVAFEITERQHAVEEGDAAEDYEDPTDDRNRTWPLHGATDYTGSGQISNAVEFCVDKIKRRRRALASLSHRRQA